MSKTIECDVIARALRLAGAHEGSKALSSSEVLVYLWHVNTAAKSSHRVSRVEQQALSQQLGLARETVSRAERTLEAEGLVKLRTEAGRRYAVEVL